MTTITEAHAHAATRSVEPPKSITFTARGLPAAQGSKSFKGMSASGRAILAESSKAVKPWRQDVVAAASVAIMQTPGFRAFDGPVHLIIEFYMPRPKSDPKSRRTVPSKTPDLSKLIRSTEDAMTTAGIWGDDALVVDMTIRKRYAVLEPMLGHAFELPGTGAVVTVVALDPEQTWSDLPLEHGAHDRFPEPAVPDALSGCFSNAQDAPVDALTVPAGKPDSVSIKIIEKALKAGKPVIIEGAQRRLAQITGKPQTDFQAAVEHYALTSERPIYA